MLTKLSFQTAGLLLAGVSMCLAADWPPIPKDELEAAAQGAHAVTLFRSVESDHNYGSEIHHHRVKIFTEEGRKHADVEIPYWKGLWRPTDIKARTVAPDGSEVEFKGEIFDKLIVRSGGLRVQAKTFTLPNVKPGSIVEYRYRMQAEYPAIMLVRGAEWEVDDELPTRKARFSLKPIRDRPLTWITSRLPNERQPRQQKGNLITLEVENVPAFQREDFMPPESELRSRVLFVYMEVVNDRETDDQYWKRYGKDTFQTVERFIGKRKGIADAVAQIVAAGDAPEVKLRKIYDRAQKIRNLTYERAKTQKEEQRAKERDNEHVEDVLKRGYGYRHEINRLFAAMARAAGFEAGVVKVSERDDHLFHKNVRLNYQLDGEVTAVKLGGEEKFFDPGGLLAPFGLLEWRKTGVAGIRLAKEGGEFVQMPGITDARDAGIERKITLARKDDAFAGKLEVTYTGHEARDRRLRARDEDEAEKKKILEEDAERWLPGGSKATLTSAEGWDDPSAPLRAILEVRVVGMVSSAGRRLLLSPVVFSGNRLSRLRYTDRQHPVYLPFAFYEKDEIHIQVPDGLAVESVPVSRSGQPNFGAYQVVREAKGSAIKVERILIINTVAFPQQAHGDLRSFFEAGRAADDEKIVLRAAGR